VGKQQNILELNGKQYDALTGKLLVPTEKKPSSSHKSSQQSGVVLDGITRSRQHTASVVMHSKTQRSHTLMRTAVHKPVASKTRHTINNDSQSLNTGHIIHRSTNAHSAPKSALISKFGSNTTSFTKKVAPLSVQPEPIQEAPAMLAHHFTPPHHSRHSHAKNPFDNALEHAQSHKQPKLKKTSLRHRAAHKLRTTPRAMNISAALLSGLLILAFFVYQNVPNLAMKVATTRAGIAGHLPSYNPSGFSFSGPIHYSPGQITFSYKSNSDDRNFTVSQKASEWNSETLLQDFVAVKHPEYQTLQDKGKTIYVFEGSNATWVNGGIWYRIEGASALNTDQLLRLASSL